MKYYRLLFDYEIDEKYINCEKAHIGDMDQYCPLTGDLLAMSEGIAFDYDSSAGNIISDYIANLLDWFVVSDRFVDLLSQLKNMMKIQILPVDLNDVSHNKETEKCSMINILDVVTDALDMNFSKYDSLEVDEERVLLIERYVLKEKKIRNHHLFRIKEDMIPIFVSEIIKIEIENSKLVGFRFEEIQVV